ncbi:sulfotransferase family protein [Fodinibius salsisoli]|uniref:Sulfotransferase n=1 Tax=Fodinibius salsisoli TaxID=2820877 RepID=A0ABT3PNC6_9BACT|nr:sulfotransferase [Fodinibius salsisoli]
MDTKRAFIVGCPRSGTTLLQSMIASHPRVISFPETHFFSSTLPINTFLRRLKLHGKRSRKIVDQFLRQNGYSNLHPFEKVSPYKLFSCKEWCQLLLKVIDQMTVHDAKGLGGDEPIIGLEKTPRHVHYISSIEQTDTSNKFIHILRNGSDVVASLHLATKQYPEHWGGERSIKKCISWWNKSIEQSLQYQHQSNHFFVVYEQLIASPERVLEALCCFLKLDYKQSMTQNFHQVAGSLTQKEEAWKDQNTRQSLDKSNKLTEHFDASTVAYIRAETKEINLKQFFH